MKFTASNIPGMETVKSHCRGWRRRAALVTTLTASSSSELRECGDMGHAIPLVRVLESSNMPPLCDLYHL